MCQNNIQNKIQHADLDIDTRICELDQEKTSKHLGIDKDNGIQQSRMKEKIRTEYYRWVRAISKTELSSANRIEVINTLAMPVVQQSFNAINWVLLDLSRNDTKAAGML